MKLFRPVALLLSLVAGSQSAAAQQAIDSAYTARIRELTTTDRHWKFNTDLVENLPASSTVPTPLKVLGYVPGTLGRLSYVADINRYFRELAKASPRTKLFSLGMSDEGREMILLAIADESTLSNLDSYRTQLARLADPRGLSAAEKARLIREAKPIYWLSGSIHSPETGSPEMLMELAYRLAVDESENSRAIVLLTLLVYLACCLATIQLQPRDVRADGAVPFKVPGGPLIPILASAVIIWLMSSSTPREFLALAVMLAVFTAVFFLMRFQRATVPAPT